MFKRQRKTTDVVKIQICEKSSFNIHDCIGMKPLYYISRLVSLWPYKYQNGKMVELSVTDKIKGYTLAIAFLIFFAIWTYGRHVISFQGKLDTAAVINVICTLFGHALVIVSILLANCDYGSYSSTFFLKIQDITRNTNFYSQNCLNNLYKKLLSYFLIFSLIGSLLFMVDMTLHYFINVKLVLAYINTYVTYILLILIFLQILYKVEILLWYFRILNKKFAKLFSLEVACSERDREIDKKSMSKYVRELCRAHKQLCNLIETVNNAHGWQIVLLFCTIALHSLNCLYFGVVKTIGEISGTIITEKRVTLENIITIEIIFAALFHCGILIFLSAKCSFTVKECLKTGLLANDLLDIQEDRTDILEKTCRKQLQLLVQHISYRNVHFSAGGIFKVDFRVISMLVGVVTTYFIVTFQFD